MFIMYYSTHDSYYIYHLIMWITKDQDNIMFRYQKILLDFSPFVFYQIWKTWKEHKINFFTDIKLNKSLNSRILFPD